MAADGTVVGLTRVKINGMFHIDVRNARWSIKRANQQHVTGGGIKQATGEEIPSGSFDEVIPRKGAEKWRTLRNFSIDVLDKEGGTVIASFLQCNWTRIDGITDLSQANATKAVTWNGSIVNEG